MANVFELNVNINNTSKSQTKKALEKTSTGSKSPKKDDDEEMGLVEAASAVHLGKKAIQTVIKAADIPLSRYGRLYGDTARQNEINNLTQSAHEVASAATTIAAGASVGGPWGAAIAAAIVVIDKAIDITRNLQDYENKMREYTIEANQKQERLGILASSQGR